MVDIGCSGSAAAAVKIKGKINIHHIPRTRSCVTKIFKGVNVGVQIA
jgi:hypothetical protein